MDKRNQSEVRKTKKQKIEEEFIQTRKRKQSYKEEIINQFSIISPKISNNTLKIQEEFDLSEKNSRLKQCKSKPVIIGICGGSSSGKSFIAQWLKRKFKELGYRVCVLKEKNFLKSVDIKNQKDRENYMKNYDFDNPQAIDWELFYKGVSYLEQGKPFNSPIYSIFDNKRIIKTKKLNPSDLLIVEGRIFLNNNNIKEKCAVKLFLDTDQDLMLSRRVFKSLARGHQLNDIIQRYTKYVKPSYEQWIEPCKVFADIVVNNFGGINFDISQFENNYEILKILQDLLKQRIEDIQNETLSETNKDIDQFKLEQQNLIYIFLILIFFFCNLIDQILIKIFNNVHRNIQRRYQKKYIRRECVSMQRVFQKAELQPDHHLIIHK